MAASSSDIGTLRRWAAEPDATTFVDADLATVIERYPVQDADGYDPEDDDWTATYDLHAAAADIWQEKAVGTIGDYDFSADGGRYDRSQVHQAMMRQVHHHLARRRPAAIVQERWTPLTDDEETGHVINA